MMRAPLRVALLQMTSTDRVEVNVQSILDSLQSLYKDLQKHNKAIDIVFLPENSLYFNFNKKLNPAHALEDDQLLQPIAQWAKQNAIFVHFGGVPFKLPNGVCNSSLLIDDQGEFSSIYHKIHLFDVDVAGRTVRESESFLSGKAPAILNIKGWRIGQSICYDLRFAELFIQYHKQNVDAVIVPSSFLVETGRAHWNTLLRARAIETQSYILAPAQGGTHQSVLDSTLPTKTTWGESLIVGPWGDVMQRAPSFDEKAQGNVWLVAELDSEKSQKIREQMPTLSHRKL